MFKKIKEAFINWVTNVEKYQPEIQEEMKPSKDESRINYPEPNWEFITNVVEEPEVTTGATTQEINKEDLYTWQCIEADLTDSDIIQRKSPYFVEIKEEVNGIKILVKYTANHKIFLESEKYTNRSFGKKKAIQLTKELNCEFKDV